MTLNIVFCASPDFAIPALNACIKSKHTSKITVISQPDKIRTRGKNTTPTPIRKHAQDHNIVTHTPQCKTEFEQLIHCIKPNLIIVIAYGMIIPKTITDTYFCVNAHGSLLPKYRGASPIQAALLNNDSETGITLIKMNEKMDEGDIINSEKISISTKDTFGTLHDKLATLTHNMIATLLDHYQDKQVLSTKQQQHENATYCHKIIKSELYLNPTHPTTQNLAKIKAFSPKPGAYTWCNKKRLKVLNAFIENDKLMLTMVQPEGKKPMTYNDFRKGNQEPIELC